MLYFEMFCTYLLPSNRRTCSGNSTMV